MRIVFVVLLLLLDDGTVPVCGAVVDGVPAAADATATTATLLTAAASHQVRGFFLLSLVD